MINVYFSELPKTLTEILELKYDETMSYEERVQKRYDYIKQQYELDNKYEGWDYLEHISFGSVFNHLITFEYMISTKGRILSLSMQERRYNILNGKVTRYGYKEQSIRVVKVARHIKVHRIVASTFNPVNENEVLKTNHLIVNHKDLIKLNNNFTNLEWCTSRENARHALLNGVRNHNIYFDKQFKARWIISDKFKDTEFRVKDFTSLGYLGLNKRMKYKILENTQTVTRGCIWKVITKQEYEELSDIPSFILDKILNDRPYTNPTTIPIQGTIVKDGKWNGVKFVIYGEKEFESYGLDRRNIASAAHAKKVLNGCKWAFTTRDHAELCQRGLTIEQIEYLGLKLKNI